MVWDDDLFVVCSFIVSETNILSQFTIELLPERICFTPFPK